MPSLPILFVAVLTGCCFNPSSSAGPKWWRLSGEGETPHGWHLCDLQLFTDDECTRPVGSIRERDSSPVSIGKWDAHVAGQLFSDWQSKCKPCNSSDSQIFIEARFDQATLVQCIKFKTPPSWGGPCTTTTTSTTSSTVSTATTTRTTAKPAKPGLATSAKPVIDPSIDPVIRASTTRAPTTTTTDIFSGLGELPDFGSGGRRLLDAQPAKILLSRSDDGDTWNTVVEWDSGAPSFRRSQGTMKVVDPIFPVPASTFPSSDACAICTKSTTGKYDKLTLELPFSEWVSQGKGKVQVTRRTQNLAVHSMLSFDVQAPEWFQFSGSKVFVTPQVPWGESSTCTTISFPGGSILNSDGYPNSQIDYSMCIADTVAPVLTTSEPKTGASNVQLDTPLTLSFNEPVQVPTGAGKYNWLTVTSLDGIPKPTLSIASLETVTWNAATGATQVQLTFAAGQKLAKAGSYTLTLPAGTIKDPSGNPWQPTTITFTTIGVPTSTPQTSAAPAVGATATQASSADDGDSTLPFIIVGAVVVLACGCCLAIFAWRQHVANMKQQLKLKAKVAPELPSKQAWQPSMAPIKTDPGPRQAAFASPKAAPGGVPSSPLGSSPMKATKSAPAADTSAGYRSAKPRAKTAEDVPADPHRKPPPPFHSREKKAGQGLKRGDSFTDDSTDGDGWVKQVDPNTGSTYWLNRKTLETSWTKPSGKTAHAQSEPPGKPERSQQKPSTQPGQPRPKTTDDVAAPDAKATPKSSEEPLSEVERITTDLQSQLRRTSTEPPASCKKTFKFLCLQWHPDKNTERVELATQVFQFLQQQRSWYLKES